MKRIFTVVSVLAIANLLGILGSVGWLAWTQRLDRARIDSIREILHEPIPDEAARLETERQAAEAALAGQPEPLPETPPVPAQDALGLARDQEQAEEFRTQRMERETTDLGRTMVLERLRLDRDRAEFERERSQFEEMRAEIAATEGAEQFKAALSVLKEVKPAEAKAMLQQIIDGKAQAPAEITGDPGVTGVERAVAYLDAMGSMERGEIMAQFVKDSPDVAAQLLERLRTFGLVADASGAPPP